MLRRRRREGDNLRLVKNNFQEEDGEEKGRLVEMVGQKELVGGGWIEEEERVVIGWSIIVCE